MAKNLQQQGVPIPANLPARRPQTIRGESTTIREERVRGQRTRAPRMARQNSGNGRTRTANRNANVADFSPTRMADKSTQSVGALEAEFLVCIALLILLMFANTSASYSDRIMSLIKRGTLVCLLFFLLALIATIGENAARIAKAFGGLVVIAILVTSPTSTMLTAIDNLIKNDWVGTGETGTNTLPSSGSADSGSASSGAGSVGASLSNDIAALGPFGILEWEAQNIGGNIGSKIDNAIKGILGKL